MCEGSRVQKLAASSSTPVCLTQPLQGCAMVAHRGTWRGESCRRAAILQGFFPRRLLPSILGKTGPCTMFWPLIWQRKQSQKCNSLSQAKAEEAPSTLDQYGVDYFELSTSQFVLVSQTHSKCQGPVHFTCVPYEAAHNVLFMA
ncbi:hypothetical protein KIL84_012343 [Mauremys mutica]|uniref:Uncharacterized protein n=1 Tax=Mauremys mutica TaxID=74926 RepID=A0A9D3XFD7_9SAUR|nr:hypothetical protein KIL84_012343 [Mauremys mutica]